MTPGLLKPDIYKGSKFEHLLTFRDRATGDPLDLTGLDPFICTVSHPSRDEALVTVTAANTDLSNGQITVTILPADTDTLTLGNVRLGIRDVQGNPYVQNTVSVVFFSPPPPM